MKDGLKVDVDEICGGSAGSDQGKEDVAFEELLVNRGLPLHAGNRAGIDPWIIVSTLLEDLMERFRLRVLLPDYLPVLLV